MNKFAKTVAAVTGAVVLVGGATLAFASFTAGPSHAGSAGADAPGTGAPVVAWNQELQTLLKIPGAQQATVHPTRSYAILHAAIYDAVVSITETGRPYLFEVPARGAARPEAAADQAAHDVLVGLYPAERPAIDKMLAAQLAGVPAGSSRDEGVRVGHVSAELLLALRGQDGSQVAPPPFAPPPPTAGAYQLTPPKFPSPVFTNWGTVTPFVLDRGDQFRPPPPPALSSASWAQAINEVERLGRDSSSTRTPDQTNAAKFWAPPIWTTWNEVADGQATARRASLEQSAKVFASLNLALADTTISLYDAKYQFAFWRPVTAIRAGTPVNAQVTADPAWNPLAATAADPSYPGAHSSLSAAAATVLTSLWGDHVDLMVTTDTPVGGPRHFTSFQAAATEAGLSRIYAGQHTRLDHDAGVQLGDDVAQVVLRALGPQAR